MIKLGGALRAHSVLALFYLTSLALLVLAPLYSPAFITTLLTRAIIMAIFALGFNILFGYTGLLSIGHAAFFGTGAYVTAYLVARMGITAMEITMSLSIIAATALAALVGLISVRYTAIQFAMITLAFGQILWALTEKLYNITGGSDGIGPVFGVRFFGIPLDTKDYSLYYFILSIFLLCTFLIWRIVNSHFGKCIQAIRENPVRAEFVGIPVTRYRWYAFILSGLFAGVAGSLLAPFQGHIAPDQLYWLLSADVIFMALLGGHKAFLGPIVGAIVFVFLQNYIISITEYWMLPTGILFVAIILFAREGIVGTLQNVLKFGEYGGARGDAVRG